MRKFLLLSAMALCVCGTSCKHYCVSNPIPMMRFVNFDSADLNTVIISTHEVPPGTQMPAVVTQIYSSRPNPLGDTISLRSDDTAHLNSVYLNYNTEAIITIPATGKVYNVTRFSVHHDQWESVHCTNSATYYMNDSIRNIPMQPALNMVAFIPIVK